MLIEVLLIISLSIVQISQKVLKEADEVMGGKVLEYEAKTIYRDGMKEGIVAGKLEGEKEAEYFFFRISKSCF